MALAQRGEALHRSSEIECGICLERVMEKSDPADRKFGLLECEHSFCLSCIRGWRSHLDGGADLDSVRLSNSQVAERAWLHVHLSGSTMHIHAHAHTASTDLAGATALQIVVQHESVHRLKRMMTVQCPSVCCATHPAQSL